MNINLTYSNTLVECTIKETNRAQYLISLGENTAKNITSGKFCSSIIFFIFPFSSSNNDMIGYFLNRDGRL